LELLGEAESFPTSPLPMVLVGLLVSVFLLFEARRYRYFNVWRARARLLETDFYAPMIRGEGVRRDPSWTELLAWPDPRRPGGCSGSSVSWRFGGGFSFFPFP